MYLPTDPWFKLHPEWFSLVDGRRTADSAQLCLTNPELRAWMADRLVAYIEEARAAAAAAGTPPPDVFSVSQNDWGGACQCEACQAIARAEAPRPDRWWTSSTPSATPSGPATPRST